MDKVFVHESSYVDEGAVVGEGTKIWHFCHIQKDAIIGSRCSMGQNVNISNHVRIGNGVRIQNNVSIYEGVELEDYVFCGPSAVFTNDLTPRAKYPKGSAGYKRTLLKTGCTVGANATIVCGHTLGKWSMIAAVQKLHLSCVPSNVRCQAVRLRMPFRQGTVRCAWMHAWTCRRYRNRQGHAGSS